jgi:hypothetical protein
MSFLIAITYKFKEESFLETLVGSTGIEPEARIITLLRPASQLVSQQLHDFSITIDFSTKYFDIHAHTEYIPKKIVKKVKSKYLSTSFLHHITQETFISLPFRTIIANIGDCTTISFVSVTQWVSALQKFILGSLSLGYLVTARTLNVILQNLFI